MINVKEFKEWCEEKKGGYNYSNLASSPCALHQFLKEKYPEHNFRVGGTYYAVDDGDEIELGEVLSDALSATPHTFPALTQRLEAML